MSTGVIRPPTRAAASLPRPNDPPGSVDESMPFDHLVVVMMENHSFDNLLGALSQTRSEVDGLLDESGNPKYSNEDAGGRKIDSFPLANTAQAKNVTQSWKATHQQIAGGMSGFVKSASGAAEPMGYYTPELLPFAYSLANTFTLANRWFSSVPGPTYPNRRFLLAGTAFGGTVTGPQTLLDHPPQNGTIFDQLSQHHVNWCDYFTDVPMTAVIPSIILKYADHHAPISKFFHDCQAGTLPAVSFVDPGIGVLSNVGATLSSLPFPVKDILGLLGANLASSDPGETEEDPQNMYWGEAWAHRIVEAILMSPKWGRTLLIYIYDEHGGYYDHVVPPPALKPDGTPPKLQPGDPPGGYDMYGPRVPAMVVSPYAKRRGVTNLIYDHTSVLATIERKWNLPALTARDANANDIMDFLDPAVETFAQPPVIQAPSKPPGL